MAEHGFPHTCGALAKPELKNRRGTALGGAHKVVEGLLVGGSSALRNLLALHAVNPPRRQTDW